MYTSKLISLLESDIRLVASACMFSVCNLRMAIDADVCPQQNFSFADADIRQLNSRGPFLVSGKT